ncbi:MAG: hypothetical protein K8J08_19985, partial [Thermoanaerobaculia bacterium]|nr:hypothetical protein [Thermoanaerobaculia bacterium]
MNPQSPRLRFFAWYVLPIVALQLLAVGSLISGRETLYLRDVMSTHWSGERSLAATMEAEGRLPILDSARAGGQPATGNPNFLPFYPTTQVYRFGDSLWVLNAHFWAHFLLMPWCFFALGRAWGLGRESAWAAATLYTWSGFALSQMSYYNLIPVVTWSPLLVASCLWLRRAPSGKRCALAALLWALLLVGGDPTLAALALVAVVVALWVDGRASEAARRSWLWLSLAGLTGTFLAAPQLVELWRILPTSFRSVQGYAGVVAGAFHPVQLIDWVVPTFFGRIDRLGADEFWGHAFFSGGLPLFLSLSPGWLALVLWFGGRWKSPAVRWGAVCVTLGMVASLGVVGGLPGFLGAGGLFRFPVKAWFLVALGGAVWGGAAFEGLLQPEEPGQLRRVGWAWGALLLLVGSGALLL